MEIWRDNAVRYLDLCLAVLEREQDVARIPSAIKATLQHLYFEALRAYLLLSEQCALIDTETYIYRKRLRGLADAYGLVPMDTYTL